MQMQNSTNENDHQYTKCIYGSNAYKFKGYFLKNRYH